MAKSKSKPKKENISGDKPICGLVMPISKLDGCPARHWSDVKSIIVNALDDDFDVQMVSDDNAAGVIHSRIVKHIYNDGIIVCDLSGKNSNCMLELGMALAFDRPVVPIIDDKTDFSFDTMPMEHLLYPRDLRHGTMEDFKEKLRDKVSATYEKSQNDPDYSCFLKHFAQITPKELPTEEVDKYRLILEKLEKIENQKNATVDKYPRVNPERAVKSLLRRILDARTKDVLPEHEPNLTVLLHHLKELGMPERSIARVRNAITHGELTIAHNIVYDWFEQYPEN